MMINESVTVIIAPGVSIRFNPGYFLQVSGTLIAEGTEEQPVTFTSNQETPEAGDWKGIIFDSASTDSVMRYCVVEYGDGIEISSTSPLIENCTTRNSADYGISATSSDLTIRTSIITKNRGDY
jgi:hypothetical protein